MDREGDGAVTSARKIAPCDRALRGGRWIGGDGAGCGSRARSGC